LAGVAGCIGGYEGGHESGPRVGHQLAWATEQVRARGRQHQESGGARDTAAQLEADEKYDAARNEFRLATRLDPNNTRAVEGKARCENESHVAELLRALLLGIGSSSEPTRQGFGAAIALMGAVAVLVLGACALLAFLLLEPYLAMRFGRHDVKPGDPIPPSP